MATVLIIDDEKSIRLSFSSILRKNQHEVDAAQNWEEARILITKKDYDVIFLDILMPKVSGLKILQAIKKARPDVLVIIMTGEPTVQSSQKALRYGATDYLTKPVDRNTLIQICSRAIERKKLLEEKKKLEETNLASQQRIEDLLEKVSGVAKDSTDVSAEYLEMARKLIQHQKAVTNKLLSVRSELSAAVEKIRNTSEEVNKDE
jgi:DNA-binding NtrC family response regulator